MKTLATRSTAILVAALVAACASGGLKGLPGYDGFLAQVQNACYLQRIGLFKVGDLLTGAGSMQSTYFLDTTSRLYVDKITSDAWRSEVAAYLKGRDDDPGLNCVLEQLRMNKAALALPAPPSM